MLCIAFSAMAQERGEARLDAISRHYASLGRYSVSFTLRAGDGEQRGVMLVDGKNSYLKVANMEVFVVDSLRYEVRGDSKEIVVDRADAYEKELLNSLNGFSAIAADFTIEECDMEGSVAVRLTPKQSGEPIYIITAPDGKSVARLQYGVGEGRVEVRVNESKKSDEQLPIFSKERYKGFELIDFR